MHHFQLNYSYTASLCEALMLSTRTNVSQFVSQLTLGQPALAGTRGVIRALAIYDSLLAFRESLTVSDYVLNSEPT